MQQDAGHTAKDDRRKTAASYAGYDDDGWDYVLAPFHDDVFRPGVETGTERAQESGLQDGDTEQVVVTVKKKDVQNIEVLNLEELKRKDLGKLKLRDLQGMCDQWQVQTGGTKTEVMARLEQLFRGEAILKRGCTTKYVRLPSSFAYGTLLFILGYDIDEPYYYPHRRYVSKLP